MKRNIRSVMVFGTAVLSVVFVLGLLLMQLPRTVSANPDLESLWSASNAVSGGLALTSSSNADGSGTGTWADAAGKWAKDPVESWIFTMGDSAVGTGVINGVTLYLKHYQSGGYDNDNFLIQVYDGSIWSDVQSYTSGSGPPTGDTTNSWDVSLTLDSWEKINAAQVRIIGNGVIGGRRILWTGMWIRWS